jgi:hypothetical protein
MQAYEGVAVQLHSVFTLALPGGKEVSFTPVDRALRYPLSKNLEWAQELDRDEII